MLTDNAVSLLIGIFGGGGAAGLIAWARFRRRDMAEVAEKLTGIATSMLSTAIENAQSREQASEQKVVRLEARVEHLERTVNALVEQMREHGLTPVFPPMPPTLGGG